MGKRSTIFVNGGEMIKLKRLVNNASVNPLATMIESLWSMRKRKDHFFHHVVYVVIEGDPTDYNRRIFSDLGSGHRTGIDDIRYLEDQVGVSIRGGWTVERDHISHKCAFGSRAKEVTIGRFTKIMCDSCNQSMDSHLLAIATIAQNDLTNKPGHEARPVPVAKKRSLEFKFMRPWNLDAFSNRNNRG